MGDCNQCDDFRQQIADMEKEGERLTALVGTDVMALATELQEEVDDAGELKAEVERLKEIPDRIRDACVDVVQEIFDEINGGSVQPAPSVLRRVLVTLAALDVHTLAALGADLPSDDAKQDSGT